MIIPKTAISDKITPNPVTKGHMTAQLNGFGLHIAKSEDELFADLAENITQLANECIAKYGIFNIIILIYIYIIIISGSLLFIN